VSLLAVSDLVTGYGPLQILRGLTLRVERGEVVSLLGHNGAGKTTLLKAISGLLPCKGGTIELDGTRLDGMSPESIVKRGVAHAPVGRRVFPRSSVLFNLEAGAYIRSDRSEIRRDIERFFAMFPILAERRDQPAGQLSGGEQQMLIIARALMSRPRVLLLDEPSLGLAPQVANQVFAVVRQISEDGLTILLAEQNVRKALSVSHRAYVIDTGRIAVEGAASELLASDAIRQAYMGELALAPPPAGRR